MVRDARRRRAPHHEGLKQTSSRGGRNAAVSKDEATALENGLARRSLSSGGAFARPIGGFAICAMVGALPIGRDRHARNHQSRLAAAKIPAEQDDTAGSLDMAESASR